VSNLWTSSWTYTNVPSWVDGSSYTVIAKAMDGAGNWSAIYSTVTFTYDSAEPDTMVLFPALSGKYADVENINGTATDTGSGLDKVEINLKRMSDNSYWDGSSWSATLVWLLTTGTTDWNYNTTGVFTTTGTYEVHSRALDLAGNYEVTLSTVSFEIVGDTVPPKIIDNQAGDNTVRTTSGTTYDVDFEDEGGLDTIQYCVWTSTGGTGTLVKDWTTIATLGGTTYYYTNWSVDFNSLLNLPTTNYVSVRAWDVKSNTVIFFDVFYILKDTITPKVEITLPSEKFYNSLNKIEGTCLDNASVSSVDLRIIRESDKYYWDGSTWNPTSLWVNSTVYTSSWTYTSVPTWGDGSSYTIIAKAQDTAGNWSMVYSTKTFTYDTTDPVSAVSYPVENEKYEDIDSIQGTASDTGGIDYITMQLKRAIDSYCWDGSTWSSASAWLNVSGTTTWNYDTTAISWSTGTYYIWSTAIDLAGNVEVATSSRTFEIVSDTTPPTIGITVPTGTYINSLTQIEGTAQDNKGIEAVDLYIKKLDSGMYFNETDWTSSSPWWISATVYPSSWTYSDPDFNWVDGSSYTIVARAFDTSYIMSVVSATVTFTMDKSSPVSSVNFPVDGLQYVDVDTISGTALDGISGIDKVELQLERKSDGYAWDGSTWSATGVWLVASGTTTWTYDTTVISWSTGTYYIWSRAADIAGNWEVPTSSITFEIIPSTPAGPTDFDGFVQSTTSIKWTWLDNAVNEDGYKIKNDTGGLIADLPANTTYWLETGLSVNTSYYRYAEAYNVAGSSADLGVVKFTLANPPTGLNVFSVTESTVSIQWNYNGNPPWTRFGIAKSTDNFTVNIEDKL